MIPESLKTRLRQALIAAADAIQPPAAEPARETSYDQLVRDNAWLKIDNERLRKEVDAAREVKRLADRCEEDSDARIIRKLVDNNELMRKALREIDDLSDGTLQGLSDRTKRFSKDESICLLERSVQVWHGRFIEAKRIASHAVSIDRWFEKKRHEVGNQPSHDALLRGPAMHEIAQHE